VVQVWEEIGYDVSPHFVPGRKPHTGLNAVPAPLPDIGDSADDWIDINMHGQNIRLFVVPNVQEDALFATQTRKEISKIAWFRVKDLPGWSKQNGSPAASVPCWDAQGKAEVVSTSKFYLVSPVIRFALPLRQLPRLNSRQIAEELGRQAPGPILPRAGRPSGSQRGVARTR
jgi:hypothetical protein